MKDQPEQLTDAAIIADCVSHRDRLAEGFETLYKRHSDAVFGFLIAMLRDRGLAEDLLQEAFFRAYKALDRFDPEKPFRPWIFRIARNAAFDHLRERKSKGVAAQLHDVPTADATRDEAEKNERKTLVHEALEALPDEPRSVLILKHFHGMTAKQIAEVLSVSLRTAKYRLKDAATLFGVELARRDITKEVV